MAEQKQSFLGTAILVGGAALGADWAINGDNSIIGKFLRSTLSKDKGPKAPFPVDPLHGRPRFGEPSTSRWEVPVQTIRAPFPLGPPDASGRIEVPFKSSPHPREKKKLKHGASPDDMDAAAWQIAEMVYNDTAVQLPPTKYDVGDTRAIHDNILFIMDHPNPPEIFKRLAKFHAIHGPDCLNPASPLYAQQRKLAGTAADFYENFMGIEKMFSREGFAFAAEFDEQDDRLAANGAESHITFNIGGAYYLE